ncbi:MAG: flavodoxin family protein [Promethearchaeota archaeon]
MKAIGIIGSPRKDGNSSYLLKKVLSQIEDVFDTEIIYLRDLNINPCNECYYCTKEESCIIEDDMQEIYNKLKATDVLIITSPVFMGGVTSRLRAFMERTWHLRRGQLKGKYGTWIVVGRRNLGSSCNEIEQYLSILKMKKIPGIFGYALKPGEIENDKEALKGAEMLGKTILDLYKNNL